MPLRFIPLLLCAALLTAGCGNSRTPVPSLTKPAAPGRFRILRYRQLGLRLAVPRDWARFPIRPPLVTLAASGNAVIALWRYPRAEALPRDPAALARALHSLIAAAQTRQAGFDVIRSRLLRINRRPAFELDALERIHGLLRRVRSTHVFAVGAEIVLEEYAPVPLFHSVDREVFLRVRRSLRITVP